jgi:hypothetical protein
VAEEPQPASHSADLSPELRDGLKRVQTFLGLGGGSLLYCLSAVCVSFGIVKLLGPLLIESKSFGAALPCLATLALYELALLAALLLVVSRRVVDDAVSIVVLVALFQVGTSMVLGTVVDKNASAGALVALVGVVFALAKLAVMRRRAGIRFGKLATLGILLLTAANYLGPVVLAEALTATPTDEASRRDLWCWSVLVMLLGAALVAIEAARRTPYWKTANGPGRPFLHTPAIVLLFALLMTVVSGAHQYLMAFTFALERGLGDIVPLVATAAVLILELLRHSGKCSRPAMVICSSAPLALLFLAIGSRSVLFYPDFGIGLLWYPPVLLGLIGTVFAILAYARREAMLGWVAFAYLLGVMLTIGYTPDYPRSLNTLACGATLVITLIVVGLLKRNQCLCALGFAAAAIGCYHWPAFEAASTALGIMPGDASVGLFGCGLIALWMLYARHFDYRLRLLGAACFAWFLLQALPGELHWRHAATACVSAVLIVAIWWRTRQWLIAAILGLPSLVSLNLIMRLLGNWRYVIVGFLLLAVATFVSLRKQPDPAGDEEERSESP